jgi:hypothetical protein
VLNIQVGIRLVVFAACFILMLLQIKVCGRTRWGEPVAWAAAFLNVIIYCVVFLVDYHDHGVNATLYNIWQAVILPQLGITFFIVEYSRYRRQRNRGHIGC